jgi:DNA mismatch endonuclease (patch repair protein)
MDVVSPEIRSRIMASIRHRDTSPEMRVRRMLHRTGLRYRLHDSSLPGKPDLVFPSRKLVLFVHGCFWHGCPSCRDGRKQIYSNQAYWTGKLARNQSRDKEHVEKLESLGWKVRVVWECEVRDQGKLQQLAIDVARIPRA